MHKSKRILSLLLAGIMTISVFLPDIAFGNQEGRNSVVRPALKTSTVEERFVNDQVILKLKGSARQQQELLKSHKLTVLKKDSRFNYILARTNRGTDIKLLTNRLAKDSRVVYVQPNYIYKTFGKPNDSLYFRQWALKKTNAEKGWSVNTGNKEVIIAILDTGVDVNHPDLQGKLVPGTNTVNPLKSVRDDDGHGTHVAGIAAAAMNNGRGVAGVAGNCRIMPVKVFDYWGGSDTSVADGIVWAADHGAKVINMSFGTWSGSALLGEAINYARDKGVIMVAAAGNWASQNISYPAALSEVIAVSATDQEDKLAKFSSFGPEIDVSAPGAKIFSTFWDQHKGSTYRELDGTSMAAPQVAGLAALLLSKKPGLTSEEVRQIIESSAVDLGDTGWDPQYGHGRIDIHKALTTSFDRVDVKNNSQENAEPLFNGKKITAKLDYGFDEDWYSITVTEKNSLQFELLPAGQVSPALEIYDDQGELIQGFNVLESEDFSPDPAYWELISPKPTIKVGEAVYGLVNPISAGQYYMRVFGNHNRWSDAYYTLTANIMSPETMINDKWEPNNSLQEAPEIQLGNLVMGSMNPSGDEDWFKVYLSPEKIYQIDVTGLPELDLAIELYGEPLKDSDIDEEDFADLWGNDYAITIVDNGGQGKNESGTFRIYDDKPGFYYLKVLDRVKGGVNGSYSLKIQDFRPPKDSYEPNDVEDQAANISPEEKVAANFKGEQDTDWFCVEVPKTGILELWWEAEEFLKPEISLYDADKRLVGYHDFWSTEDEESPAKGPLSFKIVPGKYYLEIANSWGAVTGTYNFILKLKDFHFVDREMNDTADKALKLILGQAAKGTLYPAGDMDYYTFDIEEKGPVLVKLTPPKNLDSIMAVYKEPEDVDSEGEDSNDDSYAEEDAPRYEEPDLEFLTEINSGGYGQPDVGVFMASKPGRYYVAVAGWSEFKGTAVTSPYSLEVYPFNGKPDLWENNNTLKSARAIGNNAVFGPTFMGTEDKDWYKIYVPKKSYLSVKLEVPSDIDGVLELYDPAGRLITKADQALTGEEEAIGLTIFKSGVYFIKAYDYLGNASVLPYKLSVKYYQPVTKR